MSIAHKYRKTLRRDLKYVHSHFFLQSFQQISCWPNSGATQNEVMSYLDDELVQKGVSLNGSMQFSDIKVLTIYHCIINPSINGISHTSTFLPN